MNKRLWKVLSSNARASIRNHGKDTPLRIFPYAGLCDVSKEKQEYQAWLNEWACYAVEFYGGTWEYSPNQGF